jgi:hypothetical protein
LKRADPDVERLRSQIEHFMHGWTASGLGDRIFGDPTTVYCWLHGQRIPQIRLREKVRAFMRRYRKSVMI